MKYKIISSYDSKRVESQVERYLKEGWNLYGYLQVAPAGRSKANYSQAMVFYSTSGTKEPPKPEGTSKPLDKDNSSPFTGGYPKPKISSLVEESVRKEEAKRLNIRDAVRTFKDKQESKNEKKD